MKTEFPRLKQTLYPLPSTLYHFTLGRNAKSIQEKGLLRMQTNPKESYSCVFAVGQYNFSKQQCSRPNMETPSKLESLLFYIQTKLGRKTPNDKVDETLDLFAIDVPTYENLKIRDKRIHHFPHEGRPEEEKRAMCNATLYTPNDYQTHPTLACNGRLEFLFFEDISPRFLKLLRKVPVNELPSATECKSSKIFDNNKKILNAFGLSLDTSKDWSK